MQAIQVNARYIRSLRHLMARDDVRYYLCGVLVKCDSRGKFYVATNGHILGAYCEPWLEGETPQVCELIIPADVVKAMKPAGKHIDHCYLSAAGDVQNHGGEKCGVRYTLAGLHGGDVTFTAIDGKFPDWTRVIPHTVSCEPSHYNYEYLADFNACARDGWNAKYSVELYQNGEGTAIVKNGCPHFVGAIMPVRQGSSPKASPELPAWLTAKAEEAEQVAA